MSTILIIIVLILIFGGGGGYYAHGRYGLLGSARFGARFDCHHSGLARRWTWAYLVRTRELALRRRFAKPTAWEVAFGLWFSSKAA